MRETMNIAGIENERERKGGQMQQITITTGKNI